MIDVDAAAVALAQSDAALNTAVDGRIFGGDAPPRDYKPASGGCVVLKSRGGPVRDDPLIDVSIQAKCYGPTAPAAWTVYQVLYDALHETSGGQVTFSRSEISGQYLTEPGTGRAYILAYFRMFMRP